MGIPSFYRQLCKRFPKLITSRIVPNKTEWLGLDFNCAMYHVLKTYQTDHPFVFEQQDVWENGFCKAIVAYLNTIIILIKPTRGVYVACDGVVCAAKRKQQRLRRFKNQIVSNETWDQNAITPGTVFMKRFGCMLLSDCVEIGARLNLEIHVSTPAEPGEGEHKLLRFFRSRMPKSCVIYGLDADLILLSLLLHVDCNTEIRLLRESQEFEATAIAGEWRTLDIISLGLLMMGNTDNKGKTRDFVAAMSLLGNDFLPRSLTRTVRDDGISQLLHDLDTSCWSKGCWIIDPINGMVSKNGLISLLHIWKTTEQHDVNNVARSASQSRNRVAHSVERNVEITKLDNPGTYRKVYADWNPGTPQKYLQGFAWVWDYYSGRPVDQSWYFDEHLPPLWSDVHTTLFLSDVHTVEPPQIIYSDPLPDKIHLLAVLPMSSLTRLLNPSMKFLHDVGVWYWPTSWSVFTVGRVQSWEFEPIIPQIPESVLRKQRFDDTQTKV